MEEKRSARGKRILIVDDEPDILGSLKDLLDMCSIDTAPDFETARDLLEKNPYDAAVLDIMGVRGYDLLALTTQKDIPTLMLTAHALSPDNFVRSVKGGAGAYVPKERITEIEIFLLDVLEAREKGEKGLGKWFTRLEDFFEKKFGSYWKEKSSPDFWKKFY
ncbi:MAG: response regulator [Deltaproteobacteria bacterium]|nr:response regulator [Deltaproteobacteria bacterium]